VERIQAWCDAWAGAMSVGLIWVGMFLVAVGVTSSFVAAKKETSRHRQAGRRPFLTGWVLFALGNALACAMMWNFD